MKIIFEICGYKSESGSGLLEEVLMCFYVFINLINNKIIITVKSLTKKSKCDIYTSHCTKLVTYNYFSCIIKFRNSCRERAQSLVPDVL